MKKMRRSLARAEVFEGGVQPSGAVIFLSVFGQPVATHRRTRLEGVLAVLGEIRGGGPVWDVESGGTVCVLVADCQRPQSRARLKPETMIVTFEEFRPAHDFFDYTGVVPPSRIHRDQSGDGQSGGGPFLQQARDGGAMDQRRQAGGEDDAAELPSFPVQ